MIEVPPDTEDDLRFTINKSKDVNINLSGNDIIDSPTPLIHKRPTTIDMVDDEECIQMPEESSSEAPPLFDDGDDDLVRTLFCTFKKL